MSTLPRFHISNSSSFSSNILINSIESSSVNCSKEVFICCWTLFTNWHWVTQSLPKVHLKSQWSLKDKNKQTNQGDSVIGELHPTNTFVSFTYRSFRSFSPPKVKIGEKSSSGSGRTKAIWNIPEHSVLLNNVCSQKKLFKQNLTCWGFIRA